MIIIIIAIKTYREEKTSSSSPFEMSAAIVSKTKAKAASCLLKEYDKGRVDW